MSASSFVRPLIGRTLTQSGGNSQWQVTCVKGVSISRKRGYIFARDVVRAERDIAMPCR